MIPAPRAIVRLHPSTKAPVVSSVLGVTARKLELCSCQRAIANTMESLNLKSRSQQFRFPGLPVPATSDALISPSTDRFPSSIATRSRTSLTQRHYPRARQKAEQSPCHTRIRASLQHRLLRPLASRPSRTLPSRRRLRRRQTVRGFTRARGSLE